MATAARAGKVVAHSAAGALVLGCVGMTGAVAAPGDAHDVEVSSLRLDNALRGSFVGAGHTIAADGACVGAAPETDYAIVGALPAGTDINDVDAQFSDVFVEGGEGFGGAILRDLAADGSFSVAATVADVRGDYDLYVGCAFYGDDEWPFLTAPIHLLGASGIELSATSVAAGATVTATARGFAAGETVTVTIAGRTTTVAADADGALVTDVTVPADASGDVELRLVGAQSGLSLASPVLVPGDPASPATQTAPTNTNGLPRAATDVLAGA